MYRPIGDRMELHSPDQGAYGLAAGSQLIKSGLPAGTMQFAQHLPRFQRDQAGLLLSAVDNPGHFAFSPSRPRCPLTGSKAYLGRDRDDVGHGLSPK